MKHALAGFGGGPNDIPSCQACGAVAPEDADSGCPGPALFEWQKEADHHPHGGAEDEVWLVRYSVTGYDGPFHFGPYTLELARSCADDIRCFDGVHDVDVIEDRATGAKCET